MKNPFGIILLALAICSGVYYYVLLSPSLHAQPTTTEEAIFAVTTTTPVQTNWPEIIRTVGPIEPWKEAFVGVELSGQKLVSINANIGDWVEEGQILARFSTKTLEAEIDELEVSWELADTGAKRAISLKGTGAMSSREIEHYVNLEAQAKAKLHTKSLQLQNAVVKAPDSGIISNQRATLGAIGTSGQELFRIIRQGRLEWHGQILAAQLQDVSLGKDVLLELPNGTQAKAKITKIAPTIDPSTRMGTVYAEIVDKSNALPGMFAEGTIFLANSSALVLPRNCVVVQDGYSYVYKIDMSSSSPTAIQQKVKTGRVSGQSIEVTEGINKHDVIARRGAGFLSDGDKIRIINASSTLLSNTEEGTIE